jgi:hypothetical protein
MGKEFEMVLEACITNSNMRTRLTLHHASGELYECERIDEGENCGGTIFTFIQTDYVVCLKCGKQQPLVLGWIEGGKVIAKENLI